MKLTQVYTTDGNEGKIYHFVLTLKNQYHGFFKFAFRYNNVCEWLELTPDFSYHTAWQLRKISAAMTRLSKMNYAQMHKITNMDDPKIALSNTKNLIGFHEMLEEHNLFINGGI